MFEHIFYITSNIILVVFHQFIQIEQTNDLKSFPMIVIMKTGKRHKNP